MKPKRIRDDFAAAWVAKRVEILKMVRGVCRSAQDAEELYQRVFEEIFSGPRDWVPGTDVVWYARWVVKSIRSHDRVSWERTHINAKLNENAPEAKPNPEQRIISAEIYDEIHDELPKGLVRAVFLEEPGNHVPRDIADALNVPVEAVYEANKKIKEVAARVLARHGIIPAWHKLEDPS